METSWDFFSDHARNHPAIGFCYPSTGLSWKHQIQDGAPVNDSVNRWFIFVAEKTMVYGRYNYSTTIVNGDYFMVYKPTHIWKASPRDIWKALQKIHGEFLSKSRPFVGHGGANVGI